MKIFSTRKMKMINEDRTRKQFNDTRVVVKELKVSR
jgi:hypothetical protein